MSVRGATAMIVGAAGWVGLVLVRLRSVEETMWIARDDAVITLSHARNAAQFGSIGVSPGGDRVEGFSSPLHFIVGYVLQLAGDPGYRTLSMAILVGASALTGAAVVALLRSLARNVGNDSLATDVLAGALACGAALWVISSWTSVGWIGSGMENPVVVCAGLLVVSAASRTNAARARQGVLVIALVAFMVARVEFAAFTVPVAIAAGWMLAEVGPNKRRVRTCAETVGAALTLVGAVHLLRKWYFGEWLPNTAVVQERASGSNQLLIAALLSLGLIALVGVAALRGRTRTLANWPEAARVLAACAVGAAGAVAVLDATGQTSGSLVDLFRLRPIAPLVVLIAVLFVVERSLSPGPAFVDVVFFTLSAVPLAQYIALGPARLDGFRVAVIAVPFLAVWAASLALRIVLAARAKDPAPPLLDGARAMGLAALLLVGVLAGLTFTHKGDGARQLNFEVASADTIIGIVDDVRSQHLGDGLVLLANPDLGKVSFAKNAVMVDLGFLGDPLLTRISDRRPDLVIPYLHFIARPDVLELHGLWSCTYTAWLDSAEFLDAYEPQDPARLGGDAPFEDCGFGGRWIVWLRTDAEPEFALTRALLDSPNPAPVVTQALAGCAARDGDVFRCQDVRRSVQRASQALRDAGTFDDAVDAMRASPSGSFDVPLLKRNAGWAGDAYEALLELTGG